MPSRLQMELNIFVIVDAFAILLMTKGKLVSMTTQLPSASEDEHNTLEGNTPAVADNVQQRTCQPELQANTENRPQEFQDLEPQQGQTVTRSGRVSRPPKRYQDKDFVFF